MIEIIPNWHPIWVHFAVALLITGAGLYLLLGWRKSDSSGLPTSGLTVARWMLWLGVMAALVALISGYLASISVVHDDLAHANMMVHQKWAYGATSIFVLAAVLEYFRRTKGRASVLVAFLMVAGGFALVKTGLEGAENVYVHGLGVRRLPEISTHEHEQEMEMPNPAEVGSDDGHSHSHGESEAVVQPDTSIDTVEHPASQVAVDLNRAIGTGDIERLKSLLAPDVLIFESGNVESSLAEYESHHMKADMAFMSSMNTEVISRRVIDAEGVATVVTRSRIYGTYKENEIDLINTETLVLKKLNGHWKVVHIHWSSS